MASFRDLEFSSGMLGGDRAVLFFPNGYGASVVRNAYSYGGDRGLYEIAVLAGAGRYACKICYDTPITDDVLGHQSKAAVTEALRKIEALPARKSEAA